MFHASSRNILPLAVVTAVGLASAAPAAGGPPAAETLAQLRTGFAEPPVEMRPWVHWFWWDGVVSRDEIARELGELREAGFGAAEIRIITQYGWAAHRRPRGMDTDSLTRIGHERLEYLSPAWLETMAFTFETAKRLGLRLSLNLGKGWPPGGPWITEEHRSKLLVWETRELEGGESFALPAPAAGTRVMAWRLSDGRRSVDPDSWRELAPAGWVAPEGRWLVATFSVRPGGLVDKGEGPEVDPGSRAAMRFHLEHLFGRLDAALRPYYGNVFVDAVSDSWEFAVPDHGAPGRNWTEGLPEAFRAATGRDFWPAAYALLGYGPDAAVVKAGLERVEWALVRDAYFGTINEFLHARGLGQRAQIYGRGLHRDLLEAYALVDTPEVEQGTYLVPEAVWVARTTGKPVVSSESFTFLSRKLGRVRRPHDEWESNPGHLRASANESFGEGVNRIQFHSFSYSPPELPYPGWRMYAEIQLNRNTPWWPHIRPLTDWLARNHRVLQAGRPVADALVYPVVSDPPDGPFRERGDRQPTSAADAIDGASRETLPLVVAAHAAGRYAVRHVVPLQPVATAEEAELLRALTGGGALVEAAGGDWREAIRRTRSVTWSPGHRDLMYQRREVDGADVYFFANLGDDFAGELRFPTHAGPVELWDADTGAMRPAARLLRRGQGVVLPLELPHAESIVVVLPHDGAMPLHVTAASGGAVVREADGGLVARVDAPGSYAFTLSDGSTRRGAVELPAAFPIAETWKLVVAAEQALSPLEPQDLELERLVSWRDLPALARYAGSATYHARFELPSAWDASDLRTTLELGEVFETAKVRVNGVDAGLAWNPPYRLDLGRLLRAGVNEIEITVANQMKNSLPAGDGFLRRLGSDSRGTTRPDGGDDYTRPSGLLGPVVLRPAREIRLAPASGKDD